MSWPPKVGEPLPNAADAIGVREKLLRYSLNATHKYGGPKAHGFRQILGITIHHVDYVENSIRLAILTAPIRSLRTNPHRGINCVVEFQLRGVRDKKARAINLRTSWELVEADAPPRLVTAYLRPKLKSNDSR
jgi:hypothetical protein